MSGWSQRLHEHASLAGYGVARAVPSVVSVLMQAYLAHRLSGRDFGTLVLATSAAFVIYGTLMHWLNATVERLLPADPSGRATFLSSVLAVFAAVYALLGACLFLCAKFIPGLVTLSLDLVEVGFGVMAFIGAEFVHNFGLEVARRSLHDRTYLQLALLRAATVFAAAIGAVQVTAAPGSILLAMAVGSLVAMAIVRPVPHRYVGVGDIRWQTVRQIIAYGSPVAVACFFRSVSERADRFLMAGTFGVELAGIYATIVDFTRRALEVPAIAVYLHAFPRLIAAWTDGLEEHARLLIYRNWVRLVLLVAPSALAFAVIGQSIILHLYGPAFGRMSAEITPTIAAATVLECIRQYHYDLPFLLATRTVYTMLVSVLGGSITVAMIYAGIHVAGIPGAATAMLCSRAVMLVLSSFLGRRLVAVGPPRVELVGTMLIAGIAVTVLWRLNQILGVWGEISASTASATFFIFAFTLLHRITSIPAALLRDHSGFQER